MGVPEGIFGVFGTHEIEDRNVFQTGIFVTEASTLSPFVVHAETKDFQLAFQLNDEFDKAGRVWLGCAVPGGIGQYSLLRGPAGLVVRAESYFRPVTPAEIDADIDELGEQVLGSRLEEVPECEREGLIIAPFLDTKYVYTGPEQRLLRMAFVTRVFPGVIPSDITDLIREVDRAVPDSDMRNTQYYEFFHADGGKIVTSRFEKPEEFDPANLKHIGDVEIKGRTRLWFYPKGDRDNAVDISGYRRHH